MTFQEYQRQMERLIKVYGANKYPTERIELIFKNVGSIAIDIFEAQVSRFIAESEKAPFNGDFVMALGSVLVDAIKREKEAKLSAIGPCSKCGDSGVEPMIEKATGWGFAFQCTCQRGELLNPNFPKQFDGMGEIYCSHRAWVAGRFDRALVIRERAKGGFVEVEVKTNVKEMKTINLSDVTKTN